tara:strand:- start:484 stop:1458 length:975 start_codon:yes stop_codon:yes gene_type:complete
MSGKPTVISTFAGCGGSSLGYKWAGFEELLAIEWDQNAVDTFKLNFPDVPVWQKDIREVIGKDILEFTGLKPGELDVLDGSPPCQGFSTIGKRNVSDERNDLSYEYIRLIKELQPKVFVMENVSGMVKGNMKGKFKEIMIALKETGYNVKCKLMNSMYYEVPQSRERLIFIGAKDKEPIYPEPLKNIITMKDVLNKDGYIEYRANYSKNKVSIQKSAFTKPCLTITKTNSWKTYIEEQKNEHFNNQWQTAKRPSYTLGVVPTLKVRNKEHIERQLTIDEIKILSTFPKEFKFSGSYNQQWSRIGNAVMPKFMEHIAITIKDKIL